MLVLVGSTIWAESAAAARFKVGDKIEVFFLGRWFPAKVLATNARGEVMAEYEFASTMKQRAFSAKEVRFLCEAGALCPVREWSDTSRKFRVKATVLRISGDQVTLRKVDMEEIDVPISALCESDNRYLAKLKKDLSGSEQGSIGLAPIEEFAGGDDQDGSVSLSSGGGDIARQVLVPDPVPAYLSLTQGGAGFPIEGWYKTIGAVIPVGGKESWVLASVENDRMGSKEPTHLIWVSLAAQKMEKSLKLPVNDLVLDYHPSSHRLLTCSRSRPGPRGEGVILSIWEVLPTSESVTSVVRWVTHPEDQQSWMRLVDGNTVLQYYGDNRYVAWDLTKKAIRYQLQQEAFFEPLPTLSGNRKYFAMPEDKRVRIFDAVTGKCVSMLPCKRGADAVAFSSDGRRLAVQSSSWLKVWDLTDAEAEPRRYQAESLGYGFDTSMAWLGDTYLVVNEEGNMVLYSLEHEVTLWNYEFSHEANSDWDYSRSRVIVADHLVYTAEFTQGSQDGLAVGAVKLPGADAEQAAANLDTDSMMIIRRGSAMRLVVRAGEHTARIEAALKRKIEGNGWQLDAKAPNTLVAEITRGKTQSVEYYDQAGNLSETVSITPYILKLRIDCKGKTAWRQSSSSGAGAPSSIFLRSGESVQAEVNKWNQPSLAFFDDANIPEQILDPRNRGGIGTSMVTNRGLVAQGKDLPRGAPRPSEFEE